MEGLVSMRVLAAMTLQKQKSVQTGIGAPQPSKCYRKRTATAVTVMAVLVLMAFGGL